MKEFHEKKDTILISTTSISTLSSPSPLIPSEYQDDNHRDRDRNRYDIYNQSPRTKLFEFCIRTKNEVIADLKATRWKRGGLWFLFILWIMALLMLFFGFFTFLASQNTAPCNDDAFVIDERDNWDISDFFQITLAFGELTFTQAKALDIGFDLVVGRGGQALLAYFSWKAISALVMASMDTRPVTYNTYWTVFMEEQASFRATMRLMRDFSLRQGLPSRIGMLFIILTMGFVLVFPTLAGAMSGYISKADAYIRDKSGVVRPEGDFLPVVYVIHDGRRIGLEDDYLVQCDIPRMSSLSGWNHGYTPLLLRTVDCSYHEYVSDGAASYWRSNLLMNVSSYALDYGFQGLYNKQTELNGINLSAPALNISVGYYPYGMGYYSRYRANRLNDKTDENPYENRANAMFVVRGSGATTFNDKNVYNIEYIEANSSCTLLGSYQWGFSFLQFFILLSLLSLWTLTAWLVWLYSHFKMRWNPQTEIPNRYKAAVHLVERMNLEFSQTDPNPPAITATTDTGTNAATSVAATTGKFTAIASLTNRRFSKRLSGKDLKGGRIRNTHPVAYEGFTVLKALKKWWKRDTWWLFSCVLLGFYLAGAWLPLFVRQFGGFSLLHFEISYMLLGPIWLGLVVAIAIGTAPRSRGFFVAISCSVGLGLFLGLSSSLERRTNR
ncbi:hypothetical protein QBC35DRAFT_180227 [Podospora australis]|uniref:Uncharacterized protein n=1 Tax=Podospora australis TaxID=1536484 RepID=A0AAN7AHL1_9PEZI|nr:hypothetical protein QBC35DRAFT_180227 [Podospora australis]